MPQLPGPSDGTERKLLLGWLAFHRSAIADACAGLSDEQLSRPAAWPSTQSLHGIVRQLAQLEQRYLVDAIRGGEGVDAGGGGGVDAAVGGHNLSGGFAPLLLPGEFAAALQQWHDIRLRADALLATGKLTDKCAGNGRSIRWNLLKVINEYARHAGQAALLQARL
ncbi:MAG TPA: DUF664 domain-containing protein [Jatrophihabitans sp.]|nr:DUF664 domain-containing protein [Jatrophihabitans sp.]